MSGKYREIPPSPCPIGLIFAPPPTFGGSDGKASAYNAGGLGSIPGLGRSPGEGDGTPLQCSCLENPMDGGAWRATVYGVAKSRARLSNFAFTSVCPQMAHSAAITILGVHSRQVSSRWREPPHSALPTDRHAASFHFWLR